MLGIVLTIVGLAAIVIFSKHVYSSAKDTGRNAGLLVFINIVLGLALQWILPAIAVAGLVIIMLVRGSSPEIVENELGVLVPFAFSILGLVLSVFAMMKILSYASSYMDDSSTVANGPPPPPTFGDNQ